MKILKELYLKNVVVFKEARLPLDSVGITQIRGYNKDSKDSVNNIDVNAVGKSLLFRPLSEVIFSSSPQTQEIKSRTKNDLFTHSDSEFGFSIKDEKESYTFIKKSKKKSFDYKIYKNDKEDTKVRTKGYAENKIRSFLDYSEDEFYSIVFIDSRRVSKLRIGSPIERIQYFTNLFRLHNYDDVRKLFSSMLTDAKKNLTLLKEVESQIKELNDDIGNIDTKKLKEKLKLCKEEHSKLIEDYSDLNSKKSKLEKLNSYKEPFIEFQKLSKELDLKSIECEKDIKVLVRQLSESIKEYEKNKSLAKEWDIYKSVSETYTTKSDKYKKQIEELKVDKGYKEIKQKVITLKSLVKDTEQELKLLQNVEEPDFDFIKFKKLKSLNLQSASYYKSEVKKYAAKCSVASEAVKSLSKIHSETCPTCTQEINKKTLCNLKDKFKQDLSKYESLLSDAEKLLSKSEDYEKLQEDFVNYEKNKKLFKKSLEKKDDLKANLKKSEKNLELYESVLELHNKLNDLEKPVKPEGKPKNFDQSVYKNQIKAKSLIETLQSVYLDISKNDFKGLTDNLKELSKKILKISEKIKTQSDKVSELTSKYDLVSSSIKKLESYNDRKAKLKESVNNIEIIETLIEAYSNKGIKLLIIRQLAAMIEKNMNQYAPLLYSEPTKFKFEVKDDRNFNILICRTVNGKKTESDIRTLSGAEDRAFSFLLPLAILPLIPYERRLNIMVLDEPLQNMSPARKSLFVESFVPKLNSIVPHVVIITTDNENYPNANVYTVIKEKGTSTLVKN